MEHWYDRHFARPICRPRRHRLPSGDEANCWRTHPIEWKFVATAPVIWDKNTDTFDKRSDCSKRCHHFAILSRLNHQPETWTQLPNEWRLWEKEQQEKGCMDNIIPIRTNSSVPSMGQNHMRCSIWNNIQFTVISLSKKLGKDNCCRLSDGRRYFSLIFFGCTKTSGLFQQTKSDLIMTTIRMQSTIDSTVTHPSGTIDCDDLESSSRILSSNRYKGDINPRKRRHGARNQHKTKHFVRWLEQQAFFHSAASNPHRILDVAGGKGELSARLIFCSSLVQHVTLIDPRDGVDVASVYHRQVLPKLPSKWQQQYQLRCINQPNFVTDVIKERFAQLAVYFTPETVKEEPLLRAAIEQCTMLIGMHADSATECIVDVALKYQKPFVVVPCCVFPNLFPQRLVATFPDEKSPTQPQGHRLVPVRTYEQFCDYLLQKDARFQRSVLPFEGRNIAIWWDGRPWFGARP